MTYKENGGNYSSNVLSCCQYLHFKSEYVQAKEYPEAVIENRKDKLIQKTAIIG